MKRRSVSTFDSFLPCMRITGWSSTPGERTQGWQRSARSKVKHVTPDAFAVVHRVGDRGRKPHQVMVRFVSRRMRDSAVRRKNILKEQEKRIFINDDYTNFHS